MDILISRPLPSAAIDWLRERGHAVTVLDDARPREAFLDALSRAEGVIPLLSDPIGAEELARAPRLRAIANYAVGFNNIDTAAAAALGIPVTNTPDVLTDATADVTLTLILMAMRRVPESLSWLREGRFLGWKPLTLLGHDLRGKTLGILGLGRIGMAVAERAVAFGMKVVYHTRSGAKAVRWPHVGFETLLTESDVLTLHLPLMPETRHLLGLTELRRMKPGAVLINTARGPIVDEAALVKVLQEGPLFAAGLDVYEEEPKVHPGLLTLPNVVLLPHIGSATMETRTAMAMMAARSLDEALAGKEASNTVNPGVYRAESWFRRHREAR